MAGTPCVHGTRARWAGRCYREGQRAGEAGESQAPDKGLPKGITEPGLQDQWLSRGAGGKAQRSEPRASR